MSQQNPWAQFAKVLKQQSQRAGGAPKAPKGFFAGIGGLVFLGATGLALTSSLYNGEYQPLLYFINPHQIHQFY